jgi:hypothetical protein
VPEEKPLTFTIVGQDGKKKKFKTKVLVATKEENLKSLQAYPFFIATVDYFATGEGQSYWLAARRAASLEEFRGWLTGKVDTYFVQGAEFFVNELPPKNNPPLVILGSKFIIKLWADIIDGETESGYYSFFAEQHMNLS